MDANKTIIGVIGKRPANWEDVYGPAKCALVEYSRRLGGHSARTAAEVDVPGAAPLEPVHKPSGKHGTVSQQQNASSHCNSVGYTVPQGSDVSVAFMPYSLILISSIDADYTEGTPSEEACDVPRDDER